MNSRTSSSPVLIFASLKVISLAANLAPSLATFVREKARVRQCLITRPPSFLKVDRWADIVLNCTQKIINTHLTLQDKLLPSFYPQQNAFFVFNLRFFHRQNLFHCQQILLIIKIKSINYFKSFMI